MGNSPRSAGPLKSGSQVVTRRFESDARALVPVSDEIGGIVLYLNGRPAYYVLNGEWFEAVASPEEGPRSETSRDELEGDRLVPRTLVPGLTVSTY